MVLQKSTEWVEVRNPPIENFSICKFIDSYITVIWEPGMEFKYVNASIHTVSIIEIWFNDNGIHLVDWPHTHSIWTLLSHVRLGLRVSICYIRNINLLMGPKSNLKSTFIKQLRSQRRVEMMIVLITW